MKYLMRVDRRSLYAGLFLMAVGGVLVAADLRAVDAATLGDILRLWPLAIVALGLGLVLRRTQFSLATGMLAAAVPGLVLGGGLAVAPRFVGDCAARGGPASSATQQGTFEGPASVSVRTGCGSFTVSTAPGNGWQLAAGNTAGRMPSVSSSAQSLSIGSSGDERWRFLDDGRDSWELILPTSEIADLSLVVNAGHGSVSLPGARIGSLALTANASQVVVDASEASVADLSGVVNVGSLSIKLPDSDLTGSVRIGAGELHICAPPGVGLRVTTRGAAKHVMVGSLEHVGAEWESPGYGTATRHADLRVSVNFGSVQIDPIGGCK